MLGIHGLIELEKFIAEQKAHETRAHAPPLAFGCPKTRDFGHGKNPL
jgi:hypothetical protein